MRTLVTGGTGFVGSQSVLALVAGGHRVRVLARNPERARALFRGLEGVTIAPGNVCEEDSIESALRGCDSLLHAAAEVVLVGDPDLDVNERGTRIVLRRAVCQGIRSIVYVSSIAVLGGADDPKAPVVRFGSAYTRSKARAEAVARELQREGAPIHITYPGAVIGPDDPGLSGGNIAFRSFLPTWQIVTEGGFQSVDVRDLGAVHVRLLEQSGGASRHVVAGPFLPWSGVVDLVEELTGRRYRRVPVPGGMLRLVGRLGDALSNHLPVQIPITREAMEQATLWRPAATSQRLERLGVRHRSARCTYRDTIQWLAAAGHIPARVAGRLAISEP